MTDADAVSPKRFRTIVIVLLAAILVVIIVAAVIVVNVVTGMEAQADYERCLAIYGVTPGDTSVSVEEMVAAADRCVEG